jgi:hypothetical protein
MASQRRSREVQRLLRRLQAIRVGTLKIAGQDSKRLLTQIPPELNALLAKLDLLPLFTQPPARAEVWRCSPKNLRLCTAYERIFSESEGI